MKWLSLFSGIGGFDLALQKCGHEVIGACEKDEHPRQIYQRHFPNVKVWPDATEIDVAELPDFDGIAAGFPCQPFSPAGKRLGFEESRGTLFFEIARIAKQKRPRYLLLENVEGLLSHADGATFAQILATLDEIGYDAEWQVLNSKYFVPQNRDRIFIIAYLRGTPRPKVFPLGPGDQIHTGEGGQPKEPKIKVLQNHDRDTNRIYSTDGIARTLRATAGGLGAKTGIYAVMNPRFSSKTQNGRTIKEDGEPMFTLTAQDRHGVWDGKELRQLTPLECERLQDLPDNWTEGLSDTWRYFCIGNCVTISVVELILRELNKTI